jgi:hypothetical protein
MPDTRKRAHIHTGDRSTGSRLAARSSRSFCKIGKSGIFQRATRTQENKKHSSVFWRASAMSVLQRLLYPLRTSLKDMPCLSARFKASDRPLLQLARRHYGRPTYYRSPYQGVQQRGSPATGFWRRIRPDYLVYGLIGVRLPFPAF